MPFETLLFTAWEYDEPYGGYVVEDADAWSAMWEMRVNSHQWPSEPAPFVDFERSFLAIHVGMPGHMPGTTTWIEEVVSTGPGEYAIAYVALLNPGFDVEWMGAPVHAVVVERSAGDPASVTWLGWQTTPDGRPIL